MIASYIDHTLLKAAATECEIARLCEEARTHHFFSVCVNGAFVAFCAEQLKGTNVAVASVVGFPLGAMSAYAKLMETDNALQDGATEIDMVINIALLKAQKPSPFKAEIAAIKKLMGHKKLKVILEMCYLTEEEKRFACLWSLEAGADFLKTSTGFGSHGATIPDVRLMKVLAGDAAEVKASGGIKTYEQARQYLEAGATRIGTSNGVSIVQAEQA